MLPYVGGTTRDNVKGVPRVIKAVIGIVCPNCGGATTLFEVQVDIEHTMLKGGAGLGTYVGCAACPYASRMLMVAGGQASPNWSNIIKGEFGAGKK